MDEHVSHYIKECWWEINLKVTKQVCHILFQFRQLSRIQHLHTHSPEDITKASDNVSNGLLHQSPQTQWHYLLHHHMEIMGFHTTKLLVLNVLLECTNIVGRYSEMA